MDLSTLRRTAAELVAAAVFELYPDVQLWGGGETSTGFYYDFHFPHPLHLHLIEERIRLIVRERRPIRLLEMVPVSAHALLKKEGHSARLEALEELEADLVELIQIGEFYDLAEGPFAKNTAELAAIKIEATPLEEKGLRIEGFVAESKEALKKFLKKVENFKAGERVAEQRGFCRGDVWLAPGLRFKEKLVAFFKKEIFTGFAEVASSGDRLAQHRTLGLSRVFEYWNNRWLQGSFFGVSEENVISCLQSIGKTLTILGFDRCTLSKGREGGLFVEDELGRNWQLVRVKKSPAKGSVDLEVVFDIDKILFLILEQNNEQRVESFENQ